VEIAVAHSHCFRIRERLLRLNKRVTGHRLLRGGVIPGGTGVDLPPDLDLVGELGANLRDFDEIVNLTLRNTLVMDRLEGTGRLTTRTARDHGVLGYVARASGIDADVRRDHPFAAYDALRFRVPVFETGDVKARASCGWRKRGNQSDSSAKRYSSYRRDRSRWRCRLSRLGRRRSESWKAGGARSCTG
jgi:Ni,Fe-hydrogenase III large subunit